MSVDEYGNILFIKNDKLYKVITPLGIVYRENIQASMFKGVLIEYYSDKRIGPKVYTDRNRKCALKSFMEKFHISSDSIAINIEYFNILQYKGKYNVIDRPTYISTFRLEYRDYNISLCETNMN